MKAGKFAVIICAAGSSSRFGGKRKKPYMDVDGRAVFLHSIELFADRADVGQVILAISKEDEELVKVKWGANLQFFGVKICFGGAERFETVQNALELVKDDIEFVAVHDAARPCVTSQWVDEVFAEVKKSGAAILASAVTATIKEVHEDAITGTIDRSFLYEAQTPQVFDKKLLMQGYAGLEKLDKAKISDDAQLIEAMGRKVRIVKTDSSNIKITHKTDLVIAEAIIRQRKKADIKKPTGPFFEAQW